jgi:hypothetical protein
MENTTHKFITIYERGPKSNFLLADLNEKGEIEKTYSPHKEYSTKKD